VSILSNTGERKIVVTQNSSRIFGSVLTLLGSAPIIVVLSDAWISGVSFLDVPALYEFLWTNSLKIGFGIRFELIYLIIIGAITTILGVSLLARRTERIEEVTIMTEDVTAILECINCGHQWKEQFAKTQLELMGFPRNRTITRRKCLACGRFTRPKIIRI